MTVRRRRYVNVYAGWYNADGSGGTIDFQGGLLSRHGVGDAPAAHVPTLPDPL